MKKLRAAVIGLGVGEQHIAGYQQHPDCEVVALCDISDEKRAMAQEKYPTMNVTADAHEILEDPEIDVVSIATYDDVHYEQVVSAIHHKKHIFVEKPLCLYEDHARHIRALLKENPSVRVSSNLILRKSPRFRAIKELYETGGFGELFYIEGDYHYGRLHKITEGWRGAIDFYSVVYGGGVHIIDLFLWLTGDVIVEVEAYGNNIASRGSRFRYNDMVVSILRFKSGMIGKLSVSYGCVHPHFHPMTLHGTKATFVNGLKEGLLYTSRDPALDPTRITAAYPGTRKSDLIPSFIDSIVGTADPEVSQDDVFKALSVCFAIEKAIERGGPVTVDYL